MALHPVEFAKRLLRQADRAASASGAPACQTLVAIGHRELASQTAEGAARASFVAGRAFECAERAKVRGLSGAHAGKSRLPCHVTFQESRLGPSAVLLYRGRSINVVNYPRGTVLDARKRAKARRKLMRGCFELR
jgi:hypothetical protein